MAWGIAEVEITDRESELHRLWGAVIRPSGPLAYILYFDGEDLQNTPLQHSQAIRTMTFHLVDGPAENYFHHYTPDQFQKEFPKHAEKILLALTTALL